MSRKGKQPIDIPNGVEITITDEMVTVKGPKGQLEQEIGKGIQVRREENQLFVDPPKRKNARTNFQGLYRTLIDNMVIGVTNGFEKSLEMIGVGYRAAVQGSTLNLQVGFSHPTNVDIPEGINVEVEKNTKIHLKGINKQQIGQFAASLRAIRKPEPYQGKGIRYVGEYVRRKAGKAAAK